MAQWTFQTVLKQWTHVNAAAESNGNYYGHCFQKEAEKNEQHMITNATKE